MIPFDVVQPFESRLINFRRELGTLFPFLPLFICIFATVLADEVEELGSRLIRLRRHSLTIFFFLSLVVQPFDSQLINLRRHPVIIYFLTLISVTMCSLIFFYLSPC